jgi:hypothetical protein
VPIGGTHIVRDPAALAPLDNGTYASGQPLEIARHESVPVRAILTAGTVRRADVVKSVLDPAVAEGPRAMSCPCCSAHRRCEFGGELWDLAHDAEVAVIGEG